MIMEIFIPIIVIAVIVCAFAIPRRSNRSRRRQGDDCSGGMWIWPFGDSGGSDSSHHHGGDSGGSHHGGFDGGGHHGGGGDGGHH